jgi:hypothetical protein
MKTSKLSLNSIKNELSKNELKKIMAGSHIPPGGIRDDFDYFNRAAKSPSSAPVLQ